MALYDGGGLAGDISWTSVDLPYMWDMVSSHDSSPYQPARDGWIKSYELVLTHRERIEAYKDKLIQAWPPERNKAAQAYVDRLDHLIKSLTETYDAAVANSTTFTSAISAVASAKLKMQPLQEQYEQNKTMLAQYETDLQNRPANFTPPKNPVPDDRQENLRQQAAVIMTSLSAELAAAQTSLVSPRPYSPLNLRSDQAESSGSGGSEFAIPTPTLPASPSRSTGRTRPSSSVISHPDTQKKISTPGRTKTDQTTTPRNPSSGPVLGGTKTNPSSTNPGHTTIPGSPAGTTPPSTPGTNNFAPSGRTSSSVLLPRSPTTGTPSGGFSPSSGSPGTRGSLSHGNIIGANPGFGSPGATRGSQSGSATRSSQKPNPVGGMIGQDAGARPSQRRSAREGEEAQRRWDPDNPWETEDGVDPVLLPAREHQIDPGPSIGGKR